MKLKAGEPWWLVRTHTPATSSALEHDNRCQISIVGGGIAGALLAHAFVREGVDTILLDERPIGQGSTCASTALPQYELDRPLGHLAERGLRPGRPTARDGCLRGLVRPVSRA